MIKVKAGDQVPSFEGTIQDGSTINIADYLGKKVVLYFYPKDDTPGCTAQSCDLRDNYQALRANGYEVLGISSDSAKSHQKFIDKFDLPFDLIVDEDLTIHNLFGTWGEKQMWGKKFMGTLRTTFLIDEKGIIEEVIARVKTKTHTEQILN